ncbi:MAG TPA: M14 family zinc carboxypeptidase, partial [bacterium]
MKKVILVLILIISFFILMVDAPASPKFDLTKYHNYDEMTKALKDFQSSYSNLVKLVSAGKSFQGNDLWVMEITNQKTGKAVEKPAIFLSGGLRGDEIVGAEVCLYTIQYLLENYSKDDQVKKLIDEKVFYFMPAINPDAHDFSAKNPSKAMIKNFRPNDEDRDGKNDEDPADDLDKDGIISWMRVKDDKGDFKICKDDPRIMVPVNKSKDEKGEYQLYVEGTDDDNDKKYNEDGAGGTDLNLNFPVGWKMDFEQAGAGMYPGSEPESEAVMKFLIDHPNVAIVVIYQFGNGMLYRPYNHLADKEIPKPDLEIYEMLGKKYKKLTGLGMTHNFPEAEKKERGKDAPNDEEKLMAELENELPGELRVDDILKMGNLQELVKTPDAQMYIQQNGISDATVKKLIRLQEMKTKSVAQKVQPKEMKAK